MKHVDVLVIGGGPAGLATAIAARRKGLTVTVADCAAPPVDKACGEGLMPDSLDALHALGVNLPLHDAAAIRGVHFIERERSVHAAFARGTGVAIRRTVLHRHLMEYAANLGVEMNWGIRPIGFDSRQLNSGQLEVAGQRISSRFVIGADGQNSLLRQRAGLSAAWYESRRFSFRQHFRARPWSSYIEIYWGRQKQLFITPTKDDEVGVALISRNPKLRLAEALKEFPEVCERLSGCEHTSSERGAVTDFRRLKRITKGNVALIGDAAGSVDPITAEGMCLAFKQALVLAESLAAGTLDDYRRSHNAINRRAHLMSRLLTLLSANDGVRRRALYALATHPEVFSRLLAIHLRQEPFTSLRADELLRFGFSFLAFSTGRSGLSSRAAPKSVAANASSSE